MLLTGFCILFVLAIVFGVMDMKRRGDFDRNGWDSKYCRYSGGFCFLGCLCVTLAALVLLSMSVMAYEVIPGESVIDHKIAMYEEENARIEATIEDMVSGYMEYETGMIDKVSSKGPDEEGAIALVSLFPELKSDTLVQKQLDIFFSNNEKLKELKAAKIELSMQRWILYFGN